MKCSLCQSDLSAKTRFCPHCGHPLAGKSSTPATSAMASPATASLVSEEATGTVSPSTGVLKSLKTTPALKSRTVKAPPVPHNEDERLDALRRYDILDTFPEASLDHIAFLASYVCRTPISLINMIDRERQWFKSKVGLDITEIPREKGICAYTILQPGLFIVSDAMNDERFASHPMVISEPGIRFYAGAPLVTFQGHPIGTLCVMDRKPRKLNRKQKEALLALADLAMAHIEQRRAT